MLGVFWWVCARASLCVSVCVFHRILHLLDYLQILDWASQSVTCKFFLLNVHSNMFFCPAHLYTLETGSLDYFRCKRGWEHRAFARMVCRVPVSIPRRWREFSVASRPDIKHPWPLVCAGVLKLTDSLRQLHPHPLYSHFKQASRSWDKFTK